MCVMHHVVNIGIDVCVCECIVNVCVCECVIDVHMWDRYVIVMCDVYRIRAFVLSTRIM